LKSSVSSAAPSRPAFRGRERRDRSAIHAFFALIDGVLLLDKHFSAPAV
jgi:hypothetical protein